VDLSPGERAFVERAAVGRLATVGDDGTPHVVPICFVLLNGRFYSVVDEKPKRSTRLQRLRNIESTARAALVVDHYSDDWSELAWVMVRGPAAVLEEGAKHGAAIGALREKYPQYRTMALDDRPVLRLAPEHVNSWGLAD
jgi:PPOX class probable F420-dependent enzyme